MISQMEDDTLHSVLHSLDDDSWFNMALCNEATLNDSMVRICVGCNECTWKFRNVLRNCCSNGETTLVERFMAAVGDAALIVHHLLAVNSFCGTTALMAACEYAQRASIVEVLLRYSPEEQVRARDWHGYSALMVTCSSPSWRKETFLKVDLLLRYNPNEQVLAINYSGDIALHLTIEETNLLMGASSAQIVETLLRHSPDMQVLARNRFGDTPLIAACKKECLEIVQILLRHSPEHQVLAKDQAAGVSALMVACENGLLEIVDELLRHSPEEQVLAIDRRGLSVLERFRLMRINMPWDEVNAIEERLMLHAPETVNANGKRRMHRDDCDDDRMSLIRRLGD